MKGISLLIGCLLLIPGTTGLHRHSLKKAAGKHGERESTCICSADASNLELHASEDEISAELQAAKKRVASLQDLLSKVQVKRSNELQAVGHQQEVMQSPESESNPWVTTTSQRITKLVILGLLVFILTGYAVWSVETFDDSDTEWYHSNPCLTKVLVVAASDWLIFGVYCFTEIMLFTDDGRHLTVVEAVYVNSQIITSVGYGDFTPTTEFGIIFMTFYALMAVVFFATLTQHMIMWYIEMSGDTSHEHDLRTILTPLVACGIFGTLFYSYYPGEDKTLWQSLNMSVITFLSVGFGDIHPETTVGQLVASVWMVLGVICLGKAIVDATKTLFVHRKNLHSQKAALKAFDEIDRTHKGYIDKLQFLTFELVQEGLDMSTVDTIMAKFDDFDLEHNGTLDFKEFKAYVDSIDS